MESSLSPSSSSTSLHLGSAIVATLSRRGPMSVPFLARVLGRRPIELEGYLQPLQDQGVIQRQENGQVSVVES